LASIERHRLDATSWVDYAPNWFAGADPLLADLVDTLPWRQREVTMWEKRVMEPRLTFWWDGSGSATIPAVLLEMQQAFTEHYAKRFDSIGFNLYRDGRDSVAWHGDRMRHFQENPIVAIVSLGSPRPFQLRPRGGGTSIGFRAGHGDLLVMGGACQHDWEHRVPKIAHADGPRLSIMFRHDLAGTTISRPYR
jgi:alkylated DNA repair dioxygenase AlkB